MRKKTTNFLKEKYGDNWNWLMENVTTYAGNLKLDRMTRGNSKIKGADTYTFSLTHGVSCPNCSDCIKTCYAKKSYNRYPTVKHSRDVNTMLAEEHLELLGDLLMCQLQDAMDRAKGEQVYVRIHVSGDFLSQEYLDMWAGLARAFPAIKFWSYTKTYDIWDFSEIDKLDNINIVDSMPEGKLNYGDVDYVEALAEEFDGEICPVNYADDDVEIHCIEDCTACVECKNVFFVQH